MYTINDKMTDQIVVRCDYLDEAVTILDLQLNFDSYEIRRVSDMAEFRKGIQYIAYVKWYKGIQNDKTYVKEFLSESHYQNWENFIHSKGGKVIGINKVTNQVL